MRRTAGKALRTAVAVVAGVVLGLAAVAVTTGSAPPGRELRVTRAVAATPLLRRRLERGDPSPVPHPPCSWTSLLVPTSGRRLTARTRLGVEYATTQGPFLLAPALAATGASLAKLNDVRWGDIAPAPPVAGDPGYQWNAAPARLDDRIRAYTQAGFEPLVELRARNEWGQVVFPTVSGVASARPKPEYEVAYRDWVRDTVERYDGDGVDDMPGLVRPVRTWEFESEAQHFVFWQGVTNASWTADYLATLRLAAAGVRAADPAARIVLAGLGGGDIFDFYPSSDDLRAAVGSVDPALREAVCGGILFVQQIIQARDAYDIIEFHALSDYTGVVGETGWIAGLLDAFGLPPTEVWAGDATSAPALTGDPRALAVNLLYPADGEELFRLLDTADDPQHGLVEAWYRAEQARLAVKKFAVAAELGLGAMMLGLEQDWWWARVPLLAQRDFAYQGLVEPLQPFQVPGPRPVARSLRLVTDTLGAYSAVERLALAPLGGGPNGVRVHAYRFTVLAGAAYLLWIDDGVAQNPWQTAGEVDLAVPVGSASARVTGMITHRDQTEPPRQTVPTSAGTLILRVGESPLLVEPLP